MLTIISKVDLGIKDIVPVSDYNIEENISLNGRSTFTVAEKPVAVNGDSIKYGSYFGLISKIETTKDGEVTKIHVDDMCSLFDRNIILANESLIASTGIEDFIVTTITNLWKTTGDALMNISYLVPVASTHTPLNFTVETADGVYNFRTFLGLMKERYGIDLAFTFGLTLGISVSKSNAIEYGLDLLVSDIVNYDEVYSENVIAKVIVFSKESSTSTNYYLKSDGTVTTTSSDPLRVTGKVESVVCESDVDVAQKALDTFKSNAYAHNISFSLLSDSLIYDVSQLVVSRPLQIKTADNGIYKSFVAKRKTKMKSSLVEIECGNIRVNLSDKLKGAL